MTGEHAVIALLLATLHDLLRERAWERDPA
jgi:hypothetical protein